jgi:hypothetical protein
MTPATRTLLLELGRHVLVDPEDSSSLPAWGSKAQHKLWVSRKEQELAAVMTEDEQRPRIVCLCGSTRFFPKFMETNFHETMAGRIVLSVGFYPHAAEAAHGEGVGITPEKKEELDVLHLKKIDLADEIFVINCDGYVGESTTREIVYAMRTGKPVRWLEPEFAKTEEQLGTLFDIHRLLDGIKFR